MDFKKKTGVNYDYILALEKEGDRVTIAQYPISRHSSEIDRALECLYDENADSCDIYNALYRCLYGREYNYCLKHEYTDHYIKPIKVEFDCYKYGRELRKKIDSRIEAKVRWLSNNEKNNREKLAEVRQSVWKQMYWQIKKHKEVLIDMALPYVYANDYEDALNKHNIPEKSIIYSHERHGDSRYEKIKENTIEHKVNEDISIIITTNFCYGYSSYFHVVVIYKGIALLPYSAWVKYYYARITELLGYTRSYELIRESWHTCMTFLEHFINSAISNPEEFIRNEVMQEVNGLMEGLEEIFQYDTERFKKEIIVKKCPGEDRYIGIRGLRQTSESDEELYNIAPKEIAMIYKMEKISGSLKFLDSLREIKEIYSDITDTINRIIEMNRTILPEVERATPPVEEEIKELNADILPLKTQLNSCQVAFDKLQQRLDRIFNRELHKTGYLSGEDNAKIQKEFENNNPQYVEFRKTIKDLKLRISELEDSISKRRRVLERLNDYKELILKYTMR